MRVEIPVEDLWPGEPVVTEERVSSFRDSLARGERLAPIVVLNVEGRTIVTDGNNRVRAWVEHHREQSNQVPSIVFQDAERTISDIASAEFNKHAAFFGRGEDAFLRIRKVPSAQYLSAQAEVARELRASGRT